MACLSRCTHQVAISNSRLLALDERGVTFKWKDYRVKADAKGQTRHKTMTLAPLVYRLTQICIAYDGQTARQMASAQPQAGS